MSNVCIGNGLNESFRVLPSKSKKIRLSLSTVFVCLSVVLSIFFDQYGSIIPGITLGELLLIVSSIILVSSSIHSNTRVNGLLFLLFYSISLLFTFFTIFLFVKSGNTFLIDSTIEVVSRWVRCFAYVVFLIAFLDYSKKSTLIFSFKIYRFFCLIISAYAVLQFVIYYLSHYYLPINILPIPFSNGVTTETALLTASKYSVSYFRAYGIFTEPSFLAKFLLPGLAISFFGWGKGKTDLLSLLAITIGIIVSTSFQGIAIAALTYVICLLVGLSKKVLTKRQMICLIALFAFAILLSISLGLLENVLSRFKNFGSSNMDGSTSVRVFRGFVVWTELPSINKIFGVGIGNSANFIKSYDIKTSYDIDGADSLTLGYMNGIALTMVEYGFIPLIVLIIIVVRSYKKTNWVGKIILIQLLLLMVSSNVGLLSIVSLFYFYFVFALKRMPKECEVL